MPRIVGVQPQPSARVESLAAKYARVVSAKSPTERTRNTKPKRVVLTRAERERRRLKRQSRDTTLRAGVAKLRRATREKCAELAKDNKVKPQRVLDMFFQGGLCISKPMKEPSTFNAFISIKSRRLRAAGGPALTIQQIQTEYREEYEGLTPEERQDILDEFKETRDLDARKKIKNPSLKEKMADTAACISRITSIVAGLKIRVSADAVILLVKNRPEKIMSPQWICTDPRILHYLPTIVRGWNTAIIAKQVEALCVAGCDPTKLIKNIKDRVDALKKECVQLILENLNEACCTKELAMQYTRFDTLITANYQVVCEGWPKGLPFQTPGNFGSNQDSLTILRDAWRDGTAEFRRLDNEEFNAWKAARTKGIQDGLIVPKVRQKRSDAGTKRGPKGKSKDTGGGNEPSDNKEDDDEADEAEEDNGDEDDDKTEDIVITKKSAAKKPAAKKPAAHSQKPATKKPAAKKPAAKKRLAANKTKSTLPSDGADGDAQKTAVAPESPPSPARPRPKPQCLPSAAERAKGGPPPIEPSLPLPSTESSPAPTLGPVGPVGDVARGSDSHVPPADSSPAGNSHTALDAAPLTSVQIDDSLIDPQLHEPSSIIPSDAGPQSNSDLPYPTPQPSLVGPSSASDSDQSLSLVHPDTSVSHQNQGTKRKSRDYDLDYDPEKEGPAQTSRPKRNRVPTRRKHLGASTHPASRHRLPAGEGSAEDTED
ncbi:hypothetical protein AAF712_011642 [Marasmius tenuissimus]|uniref:Uncharacterized protein n=1 Tax=Marasmius tenuissimus TaxID=585030 RepID=A0ABR2ZKJ4_9AGAR